MPAPPGAQVIPLTPSPGQFSEPSIALNPADSQQLVAAFQVNASASYTRDGGHTWTLASGIAPADYHRSGDVSVAYDHQGRAFLCYIAFDKLGTENYWAHDATRNGIFVRRSLDGGKTWEKDTATVIAQPTRPGIPFEDKPYIVADNTHSRYAGNLYVGWTEFSLTKSIILLSRSTDAGQAWSQPIEISTHEGLPRDDNGAVEGFSGTVGPDGTLYVVWSDISGIALTTSGDGGESFSPSRTIVKTGPAYFAPQQVTRGNGFPQIAINPRTSQLVVTWSDYSNGDIDVFASSSSDWGKSWSAPVRVNNDPLHNGRDQFFQWLAIDASDGSVNVIFCDRRNDPDNRKYTMVLARSTDGLRTFANYAWSTKASDPSGVFLGDYIGLAAGGGKVFGVWTRTARPEEISESAPEEAAPAEKPAGTDSSQTARRKAKALWIEVGLADFSRPTPLPGSKP
ncbi:MAG TPA: sialidase family protein [Terriglobales bacterium]|nr:sialidase family protein [Terriglobales bacterium]